MKNDLNVNLFSQHKIGGEEMKRKAIAVLLAFILAVVVLPSAVLADSSAVYVSAEGSD